MSLPIMSRRGFFVGLGKTAFSSACTVPFIRATKAANQYECEPKLPLELLPLDTYVAGTYYYQADEVRHMLLPSERLRLRREPTNPHDPAAIEVFTTDNIKLGYVPAAANQPFAEMMDHGYQVTAQVIATKPEHYRDIDIQLRLGRLL